MNNTYTLALDAEDLAAILGSLAIVAASNLRGHDAMEDTMRAVQAQAFEQGYDSTKQFLKMHHEANARARKKAPP